LQNFWISRNLETTIGSQSGVLYYSVDLARDAFVHGNDDLN